MFYMFLFYVIIRSLGDLPDNHIRLSCNAAQGDNNILRRSYYSCLGFKFIAWQMIARILQMDNNFTHLGSFYKGCRSAGAFLRCGDFFYYKDAAPLELI